MATTPGEPGSVVGSVTGRPVTQQLRFGSPYARGTDTYDAQVCALHKANLHVFGSRRQGVAGASTITCARELTGAAKPPSRYLGRQFSAV